MIRFKEYITEKKYKNPPKHKKTGLKKTYVSGLSLNTANGDIAGKIMKLLDSTNRFYTMIASDAKGSNINMVHITGGLGQNLLKFKKLKLHLGSLLSKPGYFSSNHFG